VYQSGGGHLCEKLFGQELSRDIHELDRSNKNGEAREVPDEQPCHF
jgi:hypothetical protein